MGLKADADFSRFVSVGAYAAGAIAQDLEGNYGHRIIELERGARANKIWQTKVKRMRLPDLMCVICGRRFESKGKTKLEIVLSDSGAQKRSWRDGGVRPNDVFAFARVDMETSPVSVSNPVYVTRQSLEDALRSSRERNRKSVSEGSEKGREWPMWAPDYSGKIVTVDHDLKKIRVTKGAGTYVYWQGRQWSAFNTLAEGEAFEAGQPVAFSFRMADSVACAGDGSWNWQEDLLSTDEDVRFPAVKAARFLGSKPVEDILICIADDEANDWRVRLEAHASLAPTRSASIAALHMFAEGTESAADKRMEAVFALSDIDDEKAAEALYSVATNTEPSIPEEVRASAAWGLGTGAHKAPSKLMRLIDDPSVLVATHAVAVMPRDLPQECLGELLDWLHADDLRRAATAAHLLAERDLVVELVDALQVASDGVRGLIVLALGDASREAVSGVLGRLTPQVQACIATLWAKSDDWLRQPDTDGVLDALKLQMLRR